MLALARGVIFTLACFGFDGEHIIFLILGSRGDLSRRVSQPLAKNN